jgi:hypothetical protein
MFARYTSGKQKARCHVQVCNMTTAAGRIVATAVAPTQSDAAFRLSQ